MPFPPPTSERPDSRFTQVGLLLAAAVALIAIWILPVDGFHYAYAIGVFQWLAINGADPDPTSTYYFGGLEFIPKPSRLVLNLVASLGVVWGALHLTRQPRDRQDS